MEESVFSSVRGANARLRGLIDRTRSALAGRISFTADDVKEIAEPISRMNSVIKESLPLRRLQPDLDLELQSYAGNLEELQVVLDQMRFALMARSASLESARGHLETVGLWTDALRQTR